MSNVMIITVFGFLATLIAVMTPVIKLTSNITEIKAILQRLELEYQEKHLNLVHRVDKHGEEIDELQTAVNKHELQISTLKK